MSYILDISKSTDIYYLDESKTFYNNTISKFYGYITLEFNKLINIHFGFFELFEYLFNKKYIIFNKYIFHFQQIKTIIY